MQRRKNLVSDCCASLDFSGPVFILAKSRIGHDKSIKHRDMIVIRNQDKQPIIRIDTGKWIGGKIDR